MSSDSTLYWRNSAPPITTIAREFAEVVDGPWYEWDARTTAAIEPHIPSDRDLEMQFRARLEKLAPGTECGPSKSAAGQYTVVDGENYQRSKRYLRVRLPMETVFDAPRLSDVVRRAYLDAADLLAETIALQVAEMRLKHERVSVRWLPVGLMHHHTIDRGTRRLGIDAYSDAAVALIASYYTVAPVGERQVES